MKNGGRDMEKIIEEETITTEGIHTFNIIEVLAHITVALTIVISIAA